MGFSHIPGHNPKGNYWQGYEWSPWLPLSKVADSSPEAVSADAQLAGLYRLCLPRSHGLLYIGQSGRSVHRRLRGHYDRALFAAGLKPRASDRPLRPMYNQMGEMILKKWVLMASWTPLPGLPKGDRLGVEAELIAAYRAVMGKNPTFQFLSFDEDDDFESQS